MYNKLKKELLIEYISILNRARHIYATRRIDKNGNKNKEFIIENKKLFKNLKLADKALLLSKDQNRLSDPPVINEFVIDHNRLNDELNENYDAMYLEFLISLQHREITPEDYEYLSRLDELVKKKTLNEKILNELKTETINQKVLELIEQEQEVCGICLESYLLGQIRKHLPCGHKFHSECIIEWLQSHATTCPLDNLSLEQNHFQTTVDEEFKNIIEENDLYEKNNQEQILEIIEQIVERIEMNEILEQDVKQILDEILNLVDVT